MVKSAFGNTLTSHLCRQARLYRFLSVLQITFHIILGRINAGAELSSRHRLQVMDWQWAMSEPTLVNFSELDLTFGQELFILPDVNDKKLMYECVLVGCIPNECVMVTAPASGLFPNVEAGQRILVRIRLPSGIALFPTTVLFISEIPTLIVYVDYPRDIKFKRVRAARVMVALPILANNTTKPEKIGIAGKIVDISTSGARVEMFEPLGSTGDLVEIKGKFEVGGIMRILAIQSVIRAVIPSSGNPAYGIEFFEQDEDKLLVLLGFIFHAMAFGQSQLIS